ncbi:uncharacterized protein LOC141901522 [Tubulanus polymorphus]|uniref:uncharacterized protein LOC141901522 n=1 Tax=Tubulanus polymorphus TaxID=672921 RepID=UPI003DA37C69
MTFMEDNCGTGYCKMGDTSPEADVANSRITSPKSKGMESNITLWQFLLELLLSNQYTHIIQWTNNEGEFKLLNAEDVARLWGMRKNKRNMNYDKLSRALRYYYDKNIIKKVMGQKFVYKFVSFPEVIKTENKVPFKVKMESLANEGQYKLPFGLTSPGMSNELRSHGHWSPHSAFVSAPRSSPPSTTRQQSHSPELQPRGRSPTIRKTEQTPLSSRDRSRSKSPRRFSPYNSPNSEPAHRRNSSTSSHGLSSPLNSSTDSNTHRGSAGLSSPPSVLTSHLHGRRHVPYPIPIPPSLASESSFTSPGLYTFSSPHRHALYKSGCQSLSPPFLFSSPGFGQRSPILPLHFWGSLALSPHYPAAPAFPFPTYIPGPMFSPVPMPPMHLDDLPSPRFSSHSPTKTISVQ